MATTPEQQQTPRAHQLRQVVKWIIYPLLALNLLFYINDDIARAVQSFMAGSNLFEWVVEFASSIDTLASVILIVTLELETYVIEDEDWKGWVATTISSVRYASLAFIGIAAIGYFSSVAHYYKDLGQAEASSLCDLVGQDISFVYNLRYTEVDASNCATLSDETAIYYLGEESIVTTASGLKLERILAWIDVGDALAWILIIVTIELVIRLQDRNEVGGKRFSTIYKWKTVFYAVLLLNAAVWAYLGQWFYVWDAFVWIGAFLVIEMNVNQWRDEIRDELGLVAV